MVSPLSRRALLKSAGSVTIVSLAAVPGSSTSPDSIVETDQHGPMRIGQFTVKIDDFEIPGWRRVEIPSSYTELAEYREGDDADHQKKIFGETSFDGLEMERVFHPSDHMIFQWREQVRTGNVDNGQKELAVTLFDEEGQPQFRWKFHGAWIKEYHPPALDASLVEDNLTESILLAFDEIDVEMQPDMGEHVDDFQSQFAFEPTVPEVGEPVTFDASDASPKDAIENYEWDLGDGTTEAGQTVTHTYDAADTYTVELTVSGAVESDSTTAQVEIMPDEDELPDSDIAEYADDDGVVRREGAAQAMEDWEEGAIDTDLLLDVINAWHDGGSVGEVVDQLR